MKDGSAPSWGSELRSMVLKAIFVSILWTISMLLAGTGFLRTSVTANIPIDPDGVWAGTLAASGPAFVPDNTVFAQYSSDLLAFGLAATFVVAMFAWCAMCMLGFAARALPVGIAGVFGLLIVVGIGCWRGIRIFESAPTQEGLLVWAVIAVLGLALLPALAALATRR